MEIPGLATGADGTTGLILLIHQAAFPGVIDIGLITLRASKNPGEQVQAFGAFNPTGVTAMVGYYFQLAYRAVYLCHLISFIKR